MASASDLTKKELISLAGDLGIRNASRMDKERLVEAIEATEAPQSSPPAPRTGANLAQARVAMNLALARLEDAERRLRSAQSINTEDHRILAVAAASDLVTKARHEAMDARNRFTELQASARRSTR